MGVARAVLTPFIWVGRTAVKVAVAELVLGAGIGAAYGIGAYVTTDQSAIQSGKNMFNGTHSFVDDAVNGWFKGDTDPSTLGWDHVTKWAMWPVTAVGGFAGGFVGNGGSWVIDKSARGVWHLVNRGAEKIPDDKSTPPVTIPSTHPKPPHARMNMSYRIDDKRLG